MIPVAAAASLLLAAAVASQGEPPSPEHKISIDVRGPVALVEVTRTLAGSNGGGAPGEAVLDLALPEGAALVSVELGDGPRWRAAEPSEAGRARDAYADRLEAAGRTPARLPFDDAATHRVRVVRSTVGPAPRVRCRFSIVPVLRDDRYRIRFPATDAITRAPADVTLTAAGVADVELAGVRKVVAGARVSASGRVSTRAAWEVSWSPRAPRGPGRAAESVALGGSVVTARLSSAETAVAVAVEARGQRGIALPPSVLLLLDRSRSVGLPGLSAERDLARRLLEGLPPATRFDALFFDRGTRRLFPASRPATREAIGALDAEMVPARLQNGTDLPGALREAGELLRREAGAFGPRTLVAIITDGALPEGTDGAALDRALGAGAGVDVTVAAFAVRPSDDEPPPVPAAAALRGLAAMRGGLYRHVRPSELDDALAAALATLARGGDVAAVRLRAGGDERALAERLAPGEGRAGVLALAKLPRGPLEIAGTSRGARVHAALRPDTVDGAWLRPLLGGGGETRLLETAEAVVLVEPVLRPAPAHETLVRGSLDRTVVRNTLSLAFSPRARACYLARSGATPALRDLAGRVRLSIELARGEVGHVAVESSTLGQPAIEDCLRDGAFAIEVPRALRSDAPVTAILNLVFRPRTPSVGGRAGPEETALSAQIDLVIEELHRTEETTPEEAPALDRSMIPTR